MNALLAHRTRLLLLVTSRSAAIQPRLALSLAQSQLPVRLFHAGHTHEEEGHDDFKAKVKQPAPTDED